MGSINPNIPSPILPDAALEQPAVKTAIESIEKKAEDLIAAQGGLSKKDIEMLNAMAAPLLSFPILTAPDRTAMSNWLAKLSTYEKTDLSTLGALRKDVLVDKPPENNPYLEPGVMAMLAPILSELSTIMSEIMRQSSLLQQAMMDLTVAMAGEAFHQAIAAGEAKVHQLEMEIAQSVVACVTAAVGLGCTIALGGFNDKFVTDAKMPVIDKENIVKDMQAREKGGAAVDARIAERNAEVASLDTGPKKPYEFQSSYEARMAHNQSVTDAHNHLVKCKEDNIPVVLTTKNAAGQDVPGDVDKAKAEVAQAKQQYSSEMGNISTQFQIINQVISQSNTMITSASQAVTTALKIPAVLDEAMANAMKDMIGQLMQLVSNTMSSAQQSGQSADKEWEGINQLFRDFASTITRSIYQG